MTQRLKFILIAVIMSCLALAFVPVVPCQLPDTHWRSSDFASVKAKIEAVKGHLRSLENDTMKSAGQSAVPTYNLVGQYGDVHMLTSVFGSVRVGTRQESTWAFGVPCLAGIPMLRYDHQKATAQITPQQLDAFIEWAATAEIDPITKSYRIQSN